jgi:ribosomal protein L20
MASLPSPRRNHKRRDELWRIFESVISINDKALSDIASQNSGDFAGRCLGSCWLGLMVRAPKRAQWLNVHIWRRANDLLITKNTNPHSNLSQPEKTEQRTMRFLWLSRVTVKTIWKQLRKQAEMFRNVIRPDTRIFSPLAVAGLYVTIGHYWYLFKRLTAV